MSQKSSKKTTEPGGKAKDDAARYKTLRRNLTYLFARDGLKEKNIRHEADDEVAVDDILACEHFSNMFTAEDFDHVVAKDSHDIILKEEPHFLLVTSNGRKVIKYYKEPLEFKEEGSNTVQLNDGAIVGLSNESAAVINEEAPDKNEEKTQKNEPAASGGKKAKNKKNKAASTGGSEGAVSNKNESKKEDKESPVPNAPVVKEAISSAQSETKAEIVSGNNDKHQNDPKDSNPKSHPSSETLVENKSAKPASENNDEVLKDDLEIDSGEGFCPAASKKGSKKSSAKKKGKQPEASGGTKNVGNESKQNKDGKQAAESPGKAGKQTEKSPGSQTKDQKANESKQKNSDKPTKSEKLQQKKLADDDVNSAALSSDEEKASASLEGPPKKKAKAVDRLKKIPATFKFLFGEKEGLKEKNIAVNDGGFVKVKSIIDVYQSQYQWIEKEITDALSSNEDYIFDHDDAHGLLVKAAEKKSEPVDHPVEVEAPGNDDSWQASGKRREGPDDRKQRPLQNNSAAGRPQGFGSVPPDKLRSTLFWILGKDGADKHSIQFLPGKRLYVDEIISKVPNLNSVSVSEIRTAAEADSRKQFLLEETDGRTTIQLQQESRAPRDRNFAGKGDLHLSKSMSFILRHGAEKLQIPIQPDGFMYVDDLLMHKDLRSYQVEDVRRVVQDNDKQRFLIAEDPVTHRLKVRANQGHTFVVPDLELQPITSANDAPTVVHGTYHESWKIIEKQGLSRMSRNHIHCAVGEPGSDGVISGMRGSCDVLVFIDMQAALNDGIKFFRSANNVILSPGNDQGVILPKYFKTAVQRNPRVKLM